MIYLQQYKEIELDNDLTKFKNLDEAIKYAKSEGFHIYKINKKKVMCVKEGQLKIYWKD